MLRLDLHAEDLGGTATGGGLDVDAGGPMALGHLDQWWLGGVAGVGVDRAARGERAPDR